MCWNEERQGFPPHFKSPTPETHQEQYFLYVEPHAEGSRQFFFVYWGKTELKGKSSRADRPSALPPSGPHLCFSNSALTFGRRSLQVNTPSVFLKRYKTYILSDRSELQMLTKFRQTFFALSLDYLANVAICSSSSSFSELLSLILMNMSRVFFTTRRI